jgi:hypothetical protein
MLIGLNGLELKSAPDLLARSTGISEDRCLVKDPDPAWQRELERIAEPSARVSSLLVRWHPGTVRRASPFRKERWIPVERWIIYQLVPARATPPVLRMPYTQTFSRRVRVRIRGLDMIRGLVDRVQWEIYQETGCYAQPYWVLQGPNGGHRRNYDRAEEQLAQLLKLPQTPPDLGALPYIEPSALTWERMYQLDELRRYKQALAFDQRGPEELDAEEKEARVGMRMAILKTMDERAYEAVSGNMGVWRSALEQVELPTHIDPGSMPAVDYEAAERDFVMYDN